MNFIECPVRVPEYAGLGPMVQCNAPAEVVRTWLEESAEGPVEHAELRCVLGHHRSGPKELDAAQ